MNTEEPNEEWVDVAFLVQGDLCEEKSAINKVLRRLREFNEAVVEAWELQVDVILVHKKHQLPLTAGLTAKCRLEMTDEEE